MKRRMLAVLFVVVVSLMSFCAPITVAQSSGSYDLTWNTIDGGGDMFCTGGAYSLGGTTGQAEAGTLSSGSYTLKGGFWVDFPGDHLYLPLIKK